MQGDFAWNYMIMILMDQKFDELATQKLAEHLASSVGSIKE